MSKLAEALGNEMDELNRTLLLVQEEFRSLRLGVRARVRINGSDVPEEYLAFGKEDNAWALLWEVDPNGESPRGCLLTSAPREVRLRSVDFLSDLLREMEEEGKRTLIAIQTQTAKAKSFEVDLSERKP